MNLQRFIHLTFGALACVVTLGASACNDTGAKKPQTKAAQTHGGESGGALEDARKNLDEGVQQFQKDVKPAADFVDEKTNEAVGEGKKAAKKVTGTDDEHN